jgi:hypothetical protein
VGRQGDPEGRMVEDFGAYDGVSEREHLPVDDVTPRPRVRRGEWRPRCGGRSDREERRRPAERCVAASSRRPKFRSAIEEAARRTEVNL